MNLFKKKEEKTSCGCGTGCCSTTSVEEAKIIVLGTCCKKSTESFENVKQAVQELGINEEVINVGDMEVIAKYGVMQTPALVINNKVVTYGKLIKVEDAKNFVSENL